MNGSQAKQMREFAQLWGGFRASRVMLTANNLQVFEQLRTAKTAAAVAEAVKTDPRATEILLDAVTALGLLKKSGATYRNTLTAKRFLLKDSPFYQGDMLRHADALWKSWSGLDEVVRTGQPNRTGGRDHLSFIKAMHNNAVHRAPDVIRAVGVRGVKKALDLGGGPGTYSRELAKKGIAVTLFDLPETIAIAREMIPQKKSGTVDFMSGDYHGDDIGSGYDLVFISHIFHSLSADESRALLEKSRDALNPKGTVAVQEFFLEKHRAGPVPGALFSINMLVNTASGRSYTIPEMRKWLLQAGFRNLKTRILNETVVLTGIKG